MIDLFQNYSDDIRHKIRTLEDRYNNLSAQKKDIEFYIDCTIDKFTELVKNYHTVQFPYSHEFYTDLVNKDSANHKRNKKFIEDTLRDYLSKDAKITEIMMEGYSMYAIDVQFSARGCNYELKIPVYQNISRHDIEHPGYYIDWSILQLKLLVQEKEHVWSTVWQGYDITECNYFKESDPDAIPFE